MSTLNIGEKRKILLNNGTETGEYFVVTSDNIQQANLYRTQPENDYKFSEPIASPSGQKVNVGFNTLNNKLYLETENAIGGSRRRSKNYKRSATHRRRSSKRMSRKMNKRRR